MKPIKCIRLVFAIVLFAACMQVPAFSQARNTAGSVPNAGGSKPVRKDLAPVSGEILRVSIPKPIRLTLDNGLRVLILEDHRAPLISVRLSIGGAGALFDPAELPGLADIGSQLMRKGTATRTNRELTAELDRLGAHITISSSFGSPDVTLSASGLSDNFDQWFSVALDVLFNPSFPDDEFRRIKEQQSVALKQRRTSADFLASERFQKALYQEHPAANVSLTEHSLTALNPEILRKWHKERFVPNDAILAISGDVNAKELTARVKSSFSAWKKSDRRMQVPEAPAPQKTRKIYLVNRPASVQTNLLLGNLAIDRRDPNYIPLIVMNRIVGGGSLGRLFMNLREEKGYTYGAYSSVSAGSYVGLWRANTEVRTEVTSGALTELLKEVGRIINEPVSAAELSAAKRSIVARFALSLEDPDDILGYAITSERYGFSSDYWDTYPNKIMDVSVADVQRVAREYLQSDSLQVVAVGDAAKIKSVVEKFGPVEMYDADGNSIEATVSGK